MLFKKMFITYNFLSSRVTEKLKEPLHFFRQDASKYASGDHEKTILKFDPRSGLLTLAHCVQIWRPYRKYLKSKKNVFPLTGAYEIITQQAPDSNTKKCFSASPPPTGQS